jgi:hypothetical protein
MGLEERALNPDFAERFVSGHGFRRAGRDCLILCHSERSMIIREAMIMRNRGTCFWGRAMANVSEGRIDESALIDPE